MNESELQNLLSKLLELPSETEGVEFKLAESNYDFNKLGCYFSALANEANLKGLESSWLVLGVSNNPRKVKGTSYKHLPGQLEKLKHDVAQKTSEHLTFKDIHVLNHPAGRVIMFEISPAPKGIPISWGGHYYGRDGESLVPLTLTEIETIRSSGIVSDWSAELCTGASLSDLEPKAVIQARKNYIEKNPSLKKDIASWDDMTFLNKAKITRQGKITNTAILLLGKSESAHLLSPSVSQISWILKDENGKELDYAHYFPPFLLSVEEIFSKIRNLTYRYLPENSVYPTEITQYESYVIREALQNCIAHQDYSLHGKVTVVEFPEKLVFANLGKFIPGSVENVIKYDSPPAIYRNRFLADAMVNLKMIDTIGSGIKRMYNLQKERFFPLPDYDLTNSQAVKVTIFGKVIDAKYSKLLASNPSLSIEVVYWLDKVQKNQKVDREIYNTLLKPKKFVEGRYPNLFISAIVATSQKDRATYIRNKAFDEQHYVELVINYITKFGHASRAEIDTLLFSKLPEFLSDTQKKHKINNLLNKMSNKIKVIKNTGSYVKSNWVLTNSDK